MIKSVSIVNVQAQVDSTLEFSQGVNVITGQSDNGKTTIVRALEWQRTNRPPGETLRNWDSDPSETMAVETSLSEGGSVAIAREDGKTSYLLISPEGEETSFKAIKTDVPKEVGEALNLSDYNIQSQHDKYFLLQDSPGEVAKTLNELVGLDIIDTAFGNINSKTRSLTSEINTKKAERDNLENTLIKYEKLDEVGKLITKIEESQARIEEKSSTLNDLKRITLSLTEIRKEKEKLAPILSAESHVPDLLERINRLSGLKQRKDDLVSISESLVALGQDREADNLWLEIEPHHITLSEKLANLAIMKMNKGELESFNRNFTDLGKQKKMYSEQLQTKTDSYLALLSKAGICPICGTDMSSKKLESMKGSL